MSVNAGVEGQGGSVTNGGNGEVQPEGTPPVAPSTEQGGKPYDEYLSQLPETLRPIVEPVFQEWDKGVTQRFQELHQQYDPWKDLVGQVDPTLAQQSVQLANALEQQPEQVIKALADAYGIEWPNGEAQPTGTPETPEEDGSDSFSDPRLKQHEEMLQTMGQYLLQQQQQQQQQEEDKLLETTLAGLHNEHGQFDDNYVLALISQGVQPAQAVQQFNTQLQQFVADQKAASAPTVVGSGGGSVPSTSVDPSSLDAKGTKNLVVQLLQAANKDG